MSPVIYSPRPIGDYVISSVPVCEVREVLQIGPAERAAVWNLFWLSTPALDTLPGAGGTWWKGYTPQEGLLAAIIGDAIEDAALHHKLMARPSKFIEFWQRQDHSIFDTYEILGDSWVQTVLERAQEAERRFVDPVTERRGNVIRVAFPRKVA